MGQLHGGNNVPPEGGSGSCHQERRTAAEGVDMSVGSHRKCCGDHGGLWVHPGGRSGLVHPGHQALCKYADCSRVRLEAKLAMPGSHLVLE